MTESFFDSREIRPLYSPQDRLWYSDDGYDISAKSLRELQGKLPHVVILGYHPDEYKVERVKHKPPPEMTRELIAYGRSTPLPLPEHRHRSPALEPGRVVAPEPELEDANHKDADIEDTNEEDTNEPVPDHGVAEFVLVKPPADDDEPLTDEPPTEQRRRHRHRDDPVPVPPRRPRVDWEKWDPVLRQRLAAKARVVDIAEEINCTRNAVIGRAHRLGIVISEARGSEKQKLSPRTE